MLEAWIERATRRLMPTCSGDDPALSFPPGEAALLPHDSVSWQVFRNPVTTLVGGIAAVVLQLADPSVRAGVDAHSDFRSCPLGRLSRTARAAMVVVYGSRSEATAMIQRINTMHARVRGRRADGAVFDATDPALLRWVHATASYGFIGARERYVAPLSAADHARFYAEGARSGALYGAAPLPASPEEMAELLAQRQPLLQPSDAIFEFLDLMSRLPLAPPPIGRWLVLAAVELIPHDLRRQLRLDHGWNARPWQLRLVGMLAARVDRTPLQRGAWAQARRRLGLQ
jgi:uncharacterized protein (DUF2236 family)